MISKIRVISDLMRKVTERVYHYHAMNEDVQYIVWVEQSESGANEGDNRKLNQTIQGTIDYFTKMDMDENVDKIQSLLNGAGISFYLNSVQFEEETGYIHYEWIWEVA